MDVTPSPGPAAPPALGRPYLLERVDEAAVVQLYADGFSPLPLDQKILLWHLYNAAIAGRDIFYDQRYGHNLDRARGCRYDTVSRSISCSRGWRRCSSIQQSILR